MYLKLTRKVGLHRMRMSRKLFFVTGVYPIVDHYLDPYFDPKKLEESGKKRDLPGIDWNVDEQLKILRAFHYNQELACLPIDPTNRLEYYYHNGWFESGDAEYLYSFIRHVKPARLIEIGSGYSTLMTLEAVKKNQAERPGYECHITCIEPYQNPWLERLGIEVRRKRVEEVGGELFKTLKRNDILFVDSSHVIKPNGDVLYEILNILPGMAPGSFIHFHDIFSPQDYPRRIHADELRFFNEQYLLEAFLSFNAQFRILGALNFLKLRFPEEIVLRFPILGEEMSRQTPGSFWITRN